MMRADMGSTNPFLGVAVEGGRVRRRIQGGAGTTSSRLDEASWVVLGRVRPRVPHPQAINGEIRSGGDRPRRAGPALHLHGADADANWLLLGADDPAAEAHINAVHDAAFNSFRQFIETMRCRLYRPDQA